MSISNRFARNCWLKSAVKRVRPHRCPRDCWHVCKHSPTAAQTRLHNKSCIFWLPQYSRAFTLEEIFCGWCFSCCSAAVQTEKWKMFDSTGDVFPLLCGHSTTAAHPNNHMEVSGAATSHRPGLWACVVLCWCYWTWIQSVKFKSVRELRVSQSSNQTVCKNVILRSSDLC